LPTLSHFVGEGVRRDRCNSANEVVELQIFAYPSLQYSSTPTLFTSLRPLHIAEKPALLELAHDLIIDLTIDRQRPHRRLVLVEECFDYRDARSTRVGNFGHIARIVFLSFLDHQRVVDLEPRFHTLHYRFGIASK